MFMVNKVSCYRLPAVSAPIFTLTARHYAYHGHGISYRNSLWCISVCLLHCRDFKASTKKYLLHFIAIVTVKIINIVTRCWIFIISS